MTNITNKITFILAVVFLVSFGGVSHADSFGTLVLDGGQQVASLSSPVSAPQTTQKSHTAQTVETLVFKNFYEATAEDMPVNLGNISAANASDATIDNGVIIIGIQ